MNHTSMIDREISKLRKIQNCRDHVWVGPIKNLDDIGWYLVYCSNCPLATAFATEKEATEVIRKATSV